MSVKMMVTETRGLIVDVLPVKDDDDGYASGGYKSEDGKLSCEYSSFRGKRARMEDFFDVKMTKINGKTVCLFGIFDGHGGSRAAEYLKQNLFENLLKHPQFLTDTILTINSDSGSSPGRILGLVLGSMKAIILITYVCLKRQQRNEFGGLDQITIDSYPVVMIGDSRRVIKSDDDTCPICLSEYSPLKTLKILPLCLHRFHACCIDEWLRAKPVCPICRTSPLHCTLPDCV